MIIKDNSRSSESGHWYTRDGKTAYTTIGKNGKERNTTLRDARTSNLVPSVTTIIKCASSPGLEAWKQQQVLLASLTLPRKDGEPEEHWLERIMSDSKETGRKAAERGTAIHGGIQSYYEQKVIELYLAHAKATEKAIDEHFGKHLWVPEEAFASEHGYGGKCDLISKDGDGFVVDVKTKEFTDPDSVKGYDEHLMQLSAYRVGFGLPKARCANIFVSVQEPVVVKIVEWSEEDLQKGWHMFKSLLNFWQVKNNYK